jgi:predicted phosphodiesterase
MKRVLAIGDIHAPVERRHYLRFCKAQYKKYKCNTVIFMGDVVDWHSISFHAANPECPGPSDEFKLAMKCVQRWYKAFPKAMVCIGNHDARPRRLAESVGIPARLLRDYSEAWRTPNWEWKTSFIVDKVYYHHGHGKSGGINPAYNTAKNMGMSVVMGHCHSKGGVKWLVNPLRRYFGMDTGCGVDDAQFAFAYAREQTNRSVLSCGVVINGMPTFIPMEVGKGEKYYDGNKRSR